jgi:hypothetical protein
VAIEAENLSKFYRSLQYQEDKSICKEKSIHSYNIAKKYARIAALRGEHFKSPLIDLHPGDLD